MNSPDVSKAKKQKKNDLSHYLKETEALLKGSQEDELISSLEESQDPSQNFIDTPCNDETPMCDDKQKRITKSWVKQLNDKLENIEAVAHKTQVRCILMSTFLTYLSLSRA